MTDLGRLSMDVISEAQSEQLHDCLGAATYIAAAQQSEVTLFV